MKCIGTTVLHTDRLCLRKLRKSDAAELFNAGILGDTLAEAEEAVEIMIRDNDDPLNFHWAIEYEGKAVGRVKAWEVSIRDSYAQLGYDIGQAYRSLGLMTEAVRAVVRYLLTEAAFNRVYCVVRKNNTPSIRVCEKAGMTNEGVMRKHFADGAVFVDALIFGILASDLQQDFIE